MLQIFYFMNIVARGGGGGVTMFTGCLHLPKHACATECIQNYELKNDGQKTAFSCLYSSMQLIGWLKNLVCIKRMIKTILNINSIELLSFPSLPIYMSHKCKRFVHYFVYTGWPKNGTVNILGLCSDQQLSLFTLLDRTYFPHYNNTKIIKFRWELFILWVISYGLSFSGFAINRASELWKSGKSRKWQSIRYYS